MTTLAAVATGADARARSAGANPFDGTGMWIWQMPNTERGNIARIGAKARAHGVRTVYVKSSDDRFFWRQFTPALLAGLKAQGLKVCAWQYVYGDRPVTEADLGARAAKMGANCLIIDAETEYEGRYAAADTYIRTLRAQIGPNYPLAVAPFPYVDYHPAFPYSVFLGPGAAQYNLPQMYWKAIGTSVDSVFAHTYTYNRVYNRRIYPLGQLYQNPAPAQIVRFRRLARAYGARGVNWWVWEHTASRGFAALRQPLSAQPLVPGMSFPVLGPRSAGDLVVWAQQHLLSAGYVVPVDGVYGSSTQQAVIAFQSARGIPSTGNIGPLTWPALLRFTPTTVAWSTRRAPRARGAAVSSTRVGPSAPRSASLPALAREIPPKSHHGR